MANLIQIEQRSINPNMRVEIPLETTNFSLFSNNIPVARNESGGNRNANKEIINDFHRGIA